MNDLGRRLLAASYLEGDFLLRSGRRSKFYLDKYLFSTQPDLLRDIAAGLAAKLPRTVWGSMHTPPVCSEKLLEPSRRHPRRTLSKRSSGLRLLETPTGSRSAA